MIGNTNANLGRTKILNVVQTGTLTRNGAVFSGFSSSKYLELGARVDKGILSLDSTTLYKENFGAMTEKADNWEFVFKLHFVESTVWQTFICNSGASGWGSNIGIHPSNAGSNPNHIVYQFSNSASGPSITGAEMFGTTQLITNTDYWIKAEFTGTKYNVYLSNDGIIWNLENTTDNETKLIDRGIWVLGTDPGNNRYLDKTTLDIEKCYCKANGNFWWKGVESL